MIKTKKEKTELIIIVGLVVIFLVVLVIVRKRMHKTGEYYVGGFEEIGTVNIKLIEEKISKFSRRYVKYYGEPYRDPLRKPLEVIMLEKKGAFVPVPSGDKDAELRIWKEQNVLEGIIWGELENMAIISGNVVTEGEMLGEAKVLSISEDNVIVLKDGREIELKKR